uniref:Uncharacterized protein n=1 Tax=Oryza punctata TaxID=4537 RepID=A0A0E0LCL6_ORYPU
MAEAPDDAVEAIKEIVNFRECIGRFNRHVARVGASSMSPIGPSLNGIYQSLERDFSAGGNRRGKRARVVDVEDEEIEFEESEDGDEEDEFDDASSGAEDDNNHDVSIDELNANNDDNCDEHMRISTRVDQDELVGTSTMVEQDIEASVGSG